MKLFNKKVLSVTVSMFMTLTVCSSVSTTASDIEIYRDAVKGKPAILLMLDTSGSMGISSLVLPSSNKLGSPGDVSETTCTLKAVSESGGNMAGDIDEYQYSAKDTRSKVLVGGTLTTNPTLNKASFYKEVVINKITVPYYVRGCGTAYVNAAGELVESGNNRFDRLSRLKDAIITLLADPEKLKNADNEDNIRIGLGHFSSKTDLFVGKKESTREIGFIDGHSGTILVPVKALSNAQRLKLAQSIAQFQSIDTTTKQDGSDASNQKFSSTQPPFIYKASSGTPTAHAYAEAGAYMMGTKTRGQTITGDVKFIYDGTSFIRNDNASSSEPKQVYFTCVAVGSGSSNGLGYNDNVKQCINAWPGYNNRSGTKLISSVQNNIYIPFQGEWLKLTGTGYSGEKDTAVKDARSRLDLIEFKSDWDAYIKLPEGWRYGGWMKNSHQPMDIEPVAGLAWHSFKYPDTNNGIQYFRNLVSYRVSPFSLNGTGENFAGGFSYSASDTKKNNKYEAGGSTNTCDGNGIYFLTDGAPNSTKDNMATAIMNDSLSATLPTSSQAGTYGFSTKPSGTNMLISPAMQSQLFSEETGGWEYIGEYAKKMRNRTEDSDTQKNPADMNIRTAVVGFGSSFAGISKSENGVYNCEDIKNENPDAYNACKWGSSNFGDGGFYFAENVDDIKNSILEFVKKVEVKIDPVATGSPTIPVDSLNPLHIQPYGYYASFTPKPQEPFQLWLGNLNKYDIYNGELGKVTRDSTGKPTSFARLITSTGALDKGIQGLWTGGALEQLTLGTSQLQTSKRRIYTNREVDSAGKGIPSEQLQKVNLTTLFDADDTKASFKNDQYKKYWLNLLGYNVPIDNTAISLTDLMGKAELRQIGSVMHSTPVLLTQEGKISYTNGQLISTNRKDYLMYGSTQGLLHVIDSDSGNEVFSFVPNEMMENQRSAFIDEKLTTGGKSKLFYGIDAPWTAHTQYVTKKDGTLTVNDSERKASDEEDSLNLKGMQWVFGGLRMGGRSYYALDFSDIENPTFKFQINPDAKDASSALKQMGQSWSKPSLGYVNWGGERKLVMFVGGGYDASEYEQELANPKTSKGNGVYMFDAENGDLLWWSSATTADGAVKQTIHSEIKYSVVSQINAVDRDGDGLTDHLYFGDLGGQAFRVDLNNKAKSTDDFAKRVVTLFSEHNSGGKSPRFYEMPSVSIHLNDGNYFAAVAFSSGNRSSPLSSDANSTQDGVFVVFDNDVARSDILGTIALNTNKVTLQSLTLKSGVDRRNSTGGFNGGWKYLFGASGRYKGMNDLYALDGMLYVNVYDRDGVGISGKCGSGVAGDSYLYQFCLPTGKCDFYSDSTTLPNRVKLGAGILGTGLGQGYNNDADTVGLVVNRDDPTVLDCSLPANKNLLQCQLFDNKVSLKQLRWYESQ